MRGHELLESHSLKSARSKILRTLLIKSLNGNVLISRDDGWSCIARESVIEIGAQQNPAHVMNIIINKTDCHKMFRLPVLDPCATSLNLKKKCYV